jgi:hypothetical protein
MRPLLVAVAVALALPAPALARPRVMKFACAFGDGRTHVLTPRRKEAESDDDLYCQVQLTGVTERRTDSLAGELRLARPGGKTRAVAAGTFEARTDRFHRATLDLAVPHDTWLTGVDWTPGRRPRVRLLLSVYDKRGSPRRERWAPVLSTRLQVGQHRVHAGTPTLKASYPPASPQDAFQSYRPPVAYRPPPRKPSPLPVETTTARRPEEDWNP